MLIKTNKKFLVKLIGFGKATIIGKEKKNFQNIFPLN
jgi:hypothetical protein